MRCTSVAQTLLIVGITLLIVRWSLGKPLRHMAHWLHDLRTGRRRFRRAAQRGDLRPLANEVTARHQSARRARRRRRGSASARCRLVAQWTAESAAHLRCRANCNGSRLFAVSNREPYEHSRQGRSIVVVGSAQRPGHRARARAARLRRHLDRAGHRRRRPRNRRRSRPAARAARPSAIHPAPRLADARKKRKGFYFGFANEGLWPLCHIAHTRPIFRSEDWEHYHDVNQKFAAAVLEEMRRRTTNPSCWCRIITSRCCRA